MNITLDSVYKRRQNVDALYDIMRARSTEDDPHTNISHRALPPYRQHGEFVRSRPYRIWYLIKVGGLLAGATNITKQNEIGLVLLPDYRGKGIGKLVLQGLLRRHKPLPAIPGHRAGHFLANINPKNERSIRLFTGLGFALKQQTYQLGGD
jgi:GNAT superfamily N-acetyltransferase